ncbi:hypothetical protein [Lacticaseibacillus pantheris]|jgi:hypothetical protein|uniref:hypothetical protein n=1 Tax=Lacticaseibacillus pantheris TaxID=171523 RepID=UPI0025960544|nr:hypothetical protein [Lacticaseibacillus pantheris]WKF85066.1 hypothetical protein QY874_00195 [Lacticaseibacillus pantheris]
MRNVRAGLIKTVIIFILLALIYWCHWGQVVNGALIALAVVIVWVPNRWLGGR